MIINSYYSDMLNRPVRNIKGRVEIYKGSTLAYMCGCGDYLKSFTVERASEDGKFFGYGICQKVNVKLVDIKRELDISTDNYIEAVFGVENNYTYPYPAFYVSEVRRDENNNELSITAYDRLYKATSHTFAELELNPPYTIGKVAEACATILGLPLSVSDSEFDITLPTGANFEGTENIREVLNMIAEATQTIYYINHNWELVFKRLDRDGEAVFTINKDKYSDLDSGANRRLAKIISATELGDNVSAELAQSGSTQIVRDNAFWELREDIDSVVEDALTAIGGLTINQFACSWRGDFLVEIGDKLAIETKNGDFVYSYLLVDTVEYNGALKEETEWSYVEDDSDTESNPTSLSDALRQTYARVDKANKQIEMVVSKTESNAEKISQLVLDTESINASVSKTQEMMNESMEATNADIQTLTNKVEATMSAEDVRIEIQKGLATGTDKVITSTGFTFNEEGLTVSKSGSEMETTITEDGMIVYKDDEAVLTANNKGVQAIDLHATTYLIIGSYSRLEDFGGRTGCFWIG